MLGFFLTTLVTALSLLVVDLAVPGVGIATFPAALAAALSLGLVNGSIKPILKFLAFPVNLLTLGGFSLVVNGLCFWLASLVVPGFAVHGLLAFILGPIVLSIMSTFLTGYFLNKGVAKKLEAVGNKFGLNQTQEPVAQPTTQQGSIEVSEI